MEKGIYLFFMCLAVFFSVGMFGAAETLSQKVEYGKGKDGKVYYRHCYSSGCTKWKLYSSSKKQKPTVKSKSGSSGSRMSSAEAQKITKLHNKARAEVGVSPVTWSDEIAAYAQEWANYVATTGGCSLKHRPHSGKYRQKYGENAFMGTAGYQKAEDCVTSWISEKKYYKGQTLNSSNWSESGHYTQVVWKKSKRIGCGKAECNGKIIVFCNYDPPGNYMGEKPY